MIVDFLPQEILDKLPKEIWLIIRDYCSFLQNRNIIQKKLKKRICKENVFIYKHETGKYNETFILEMENGVEIRQEFIRDSPREIDHIFLETTMNFGKFESYTIQNPDEYVIYCLSVEKKWNGFFALKRTYQKYTFF